MHHQRIFRSADFMQPAQGEPLRSVITESADAVIVAWLVLPGQRIAAHVHPRGQDSWTVLAGGGQYQIDTEGGALPITAGDVVVAETGMVHGVLNNGDVPLRIISVVAPAEAGYLPL